MERAGQGANRMFAESVRQGKRLPDFTHTDQFQVSLKRLVPADYAYDVVKYNRHTNAVSFIQCPEFDVKPEPSIAGVVTVRADGTLQRRAIPSDPPIYHHKWLFVDDDYTGFDVEQSKLRSAAWLALPDVDKSRIGRRSYWQTHVVPRQDDCDQNLVCSRDVATSFKR